MDVKLKLLLLAALVAALPVWADQWPAPRPQNFGSRNTKFVFHVTPGALLERAGGSGAHKIPVASLYKVDGEKNLELWQTKLVNKSAPVLALVADDGSYVVTVDEWGAVGTNPLVIYGDKGKLIANKKLEDLLTKEEIEKTNRSGDSVWWSSDAMFLFGDDGKTFYVRLAGGKLIVVNLDDGTIMDDAWAKGDETKTKQLASLKDKGEKLVRERALKMVQAAKPSIEMNANSWRTGAMVCGQLGIKEAIPSLKARLKDKSYVLMKEQDKPAVRSYETRRWSAEALKSMGEEVKDIVLEEPATAEEAKKFEGK